MKKLNKIWFILFLNFLKLFNLNNFFVKIHLEKEFPQLSFQYKTSIKKEEINEALKKVDPELGQTLFVSNSSIKPDGGIIEVKDDNGNWRIVLVSEAKYQGKDIENIKEGQLSKWA